VQHLIVEQNKLSIALNIIIKRDSNYI